MPDKNPYLCRVYVPGAWSLQEAQEESYRVRAQEEDGRTRHSGFLDNMLRVGRSVSSTYLVRNTADFSQVGSGPGRYFEPHLNFLANKRILYI